MAKKIIASNTNVTEEKNTNAYAYVKIDALDITQNPEKGKAIANEIISSNTATSQTDSKINSSAGNIVREHIGEMTLEELVAGEKAAATVRRIYEDKMVMYRGVDYESMSDKEMQEYIEMSQKLGQINSVRLRIINEMETRLLNIKQ